MTTADEMEAFHIVRAILAKHVKPSRIVMRDTKSYCGVLLDDNNRKPICRLRFNYSQKYLTLMDADKSERRIAISDLADIYAHADKLVATVQKYEGKEVQNPPVQDSTSHPNPDKQDETADGQHAAS